MKLQLRQERLRTPVWGVFSSRKAAGGNHVGVALASVVVCRPSAMASRSARVWSSWAVVAVSATLLGVTLLSVPDTCHGQAQTYFISTVRFEGNKRVKDKQLKEVIRSRPAGWFRRNELDDRELQADLGRIRALYRQRGFLEVEVTHDSTDIDTLSESAIVTFAINEGDQTLIQEISFQGVTAISEDKLRQAVGLKVGDPHDPTITGTKEFRVYELYADQGYVFTDVRSQVTVDEHQARVLFVVEESPQAFVQDISIEGNFETREHLIRRELVLKEGDVLTRAKMLKSQQRIYDTGLFRDAQIHPGAVRDSSLVDLRVTVRERRPRWVGFGVGSGSEDQLRLSGEWEHRNLRGTGRRLRLRLVTSSQLFPLNAVRVQRAWPSISFTEPWLLDTRLTATILVDYELTRDHHLPRAVQELGAEEMNRAGVSLNVRRDWGRLRHLWLRYGHDWVDVEGYELVRKFTTIVERDARDSFINPTKGTYLYSSFDLAGGLFGGDRDYWKIFGKGTLNRWISRYSSLSVGSHVGLVRGFGSTPEVPSYEKFSAGGRSSVRGFREQEIGPGDFLLVANLEIRRHLVWMLVGSWFLDAGGVWPDIGDVSWEHFRDLGRDEGQLRFHYSTGLGVRLITPIAPLRLDYGVRFETGVSWKDGLWHFDIQQAF